MIVTFGPTIVILLSCLLLGLVVPTEATLCQQPLFRTEWRTLPKDDRLEYIKAVQCLLKKPPLTPKSVASGVGARYEDLVVTHNQQTLSIHFVGHFLPWHRFMVAAYEKILRQECGYRGSQPYWDWTLDVNPPSKFTKSPLWDAKYGFGGNGPFVPVPNGTNPGLIVPGRTGGGCVTNGPFKNMVVRIGPLDSLAAGNERCLTRDFSPYFAERYLGRNVTTAALDQVDFGWFTRVIEGDTNFEQSGVHGGGHFGVGGTLGVMGDLYDSPADPVFYMHHANLDRLWWSWQKRNLNARLADISGPINIFDYNNTLGGNITLAFPLTLGPWVGAPNITVKDVMDIRGNVLCYDYDRLY